MPSTSAKQHRFMAAVAKNPGFAKKAGVPQSVGEEFLQADKGRKFRTDTRPEQQSINKPKTNHGRMSVMKEGGEVAESKSMMKKEVSFMKKAGAPRSMIKHEEREAKGKKYAGGGELFSTMPVKAKPMPVKAKGPGVAPPRIHPRGPGGANPPKIHPKAPRPGGSVTTQPYNGSVTTQPYNNTLLAKGGATRGASSVAKKSTKR